MTDTSWEITADQMTLAFDDYAYALAWLTRYSVTFEYADDHPFEKPPQADLLRWIQAMARLGCAVGNNSPAHERYDFARAHGDDPAEVFNRIVAERRSRPAPDVELMDSYRAPRHYTFITDIDGTPLNEPLTFWSCSTVIGEREITGVGDTAEEAKADLQRNAMVEIRGRVAGSE